MIISLIVAVDHHMVIGHNNELPWHLPSDLQKFRKITMGKPMIMGRRTHESIGKALPGRTNIVLTHQPDYTAPGCLIARTMDQALELAAKTVAEPGGGEVMVIGGAGVFTEVLPRADRLYLTVVHGEFEGDTFFPWFDLEEWDIAQAMHYPADEKNAWAHSLYILDRDAPRPLTVRALDGPGELPGVLRGP